MTEDEAREKNRAVLAKWLDQMLDVLKPEGIWAAPNPAPLSADDIEELFERAVADDRYSRQHLSTRSADGYLVTAYNGIITKEDLNP